MTLLVESRITVTGGDAAAASLGKVKTAAEGLDGAQKRVANSAGQMRAATANLGQQIGDISQGFAAGTSAATIFAQQAGQVAFAISGMGGVLGTVGTFLSGPFGAALTGAVVILASLAATHRNAADSADTQGKKAKSLSETLNDLDRATGIANRGTLETIRLSERAADASIKLEAAKRKEIAALVEEARTRVNTLTLGRNSNFGGSYTAGFADEELKKQKAALAEFDNAQAASAARARASAAFGRAENAAKLATDPRARIDATYETERDRIAGLKDQTNSEVLLAAAMRQRTAALSAITEGTKAARAAQSEHNKELREAAAAADKATAAQTALAAATAAYFAAVKVPQAGSLRQGEGLDQLGQSTAGIDGRLDKSAASGTAAAKAFTAGTLADAAVIGQAIGGAAGKVFTGIAALGFSKDGKSDFTGVGGRLESLLKPLADTFGNDGKRIAGLIGQAAGGAATGSVVSGIAGAVGITLNKTGSQIGGAIGSAIPIPGGEIIGSILGGIAGNLLSIKQGSTTVSSSAGKISQSSTGDAAVTKATGVIGNTVTDAIQAIADQLGARIGDFSVSIGKRNDSFRVDRSGTGKIRGSTVTGTKDEAEALSLAIGDALKDGAIVTTPRVQAALLQYAGNVNKAVTEALKVKGLEDLLSDRANPFLAGFRGLEAQLKQRVDIARKYGFDLVQIEKVNAEDRAKALKDTLAQTTGSIRNLLTDLTIGSGATGSATQRLAGLSAERNRLTGLARGGDTGQLDAIASISKQIDDLQKETFGATAPFATGRADTVSLLNDLIKQAEDTARAAADQARAAQQTTVDKLTAIDANGDDQVALLAKNNALLTEIAASLTSSSSGPGFALIGQYARGVQ